MPLVKRKAVPLIPLPQELENGTVPPDREVWQIKQTGEIFLDYEPFEARLKFYMQEIFVCEYTGKSGLDFFQALESERNESFKTQQQFPDALKPRVLRACHFQIEGRLERLVDLAYDRFVNRYFLGEGVIVNEPTPLVKIQYYGMIVRVTPPKHLRDLLRPEKEPLLASVLHNGPYNALAATSDESDDNGNVYSPEQLDIVTHVVATRQLELETAEVNAVDNPDDYIYHVQLLQEAEFKGSIVEVTHHELERDRTKWNKALLKKYLKESLTRDPAVGSPWMTKERQRQQYNFSLEMPEHLRLKSAELRTDLLQRRRKQPKEEDPNAPPKAPKPKKIKTGPLSLKRRDSSMSALSPLPSDDGQGRFPSTAKGEGDAEAAAAAKAREEQLRMLPKPKYPIEDLDLDPTTVLDGRVRRSKHQELPPLPKKPLPSRDLPVPQELMDRFLMCWNTLNIFGQALQISPFTLDDFTNALYHDTLEPRCNLLGEIHSVLAINIATENASAPTAAKTYADYIPPLAASYEDTDGMSVRQREMWVHAALDYSRGWDRRARPRAADGRKGWERHLLGILTLKTGLEGMPTLPTILKHLFTDDTYEEDLDQVDEELPVKQEDGEHVDGAAEATDQSMPIEQPEGAPKEEAFDSQPEQPKENVVDNKANGTSEEDKSQQVTEAKKSLSPKLQAAETKIEEKPAQLDREESNVEDGDELASDNEEGKMYLDEDPNGTPSKVRNYTKARYAGTDNPDPESRYLTLSLAHKLDILGFLCEINLGSKVVKTYIDDCELRLTEERKEKAEINKEKKELMAERSALNKPPPGTEPATKGKGAGKGAAKEGAPAEAAADSSLLALPVNIDDHGSSRAPSEANDSVMIDEPSSRQPSSSPLPELDDSSSTHSAKVVEDRAADVTQQSEPGAATSEAGDDRTEVDEMEEDEVENSVMEPPADEDQMEVGSEVDELEASGDELQDESVQVDTLLEEEAPAAAGRGRKGKGKGAAAAKKVVKEVDRKQAIEEGLEMNAKKDDLFERDWRRYREVARIRPLGKDRFHQRFWWFDGIGPQSLIAPNGRIIYGTGRLFVQGPSQADFDMICAEYGGKEQINARRSNEEGFESTQLLRVDEWAYYEESADIEQIFSWLNSKGLREKEFKGKLDKWKHYIIEGAKSRQSDILHGFEATDPPAHQRRTRGARGSKEYHDNPSKHYLAYENSLAQK